MSNSDNKVNNIYLLLKGKPKTHAEWANSFNIKHRIKKILNASNKPKDQ